MIGIAQKANLSAAGQSGSLSLKLRLGIGAAILGIATLLTAAVLWLGMNDVANRLETALASETRMARYAVLSTQAATFLVVATEAIQTEQPVQSRLDRASPVIGQMRSTFQLLRQDLERAVDAARSLGLDEQSRYGTQSLGVARMEALLDNTLRGLATPTRDKTRLRAHVDTFASAFDPLLSQAVNTEVVFRNDVIAGIERTRQNLAWAAFAMAAFSVLAVSIFYFALIRPQFRRLDRLRATANQIASEDFTVNLPEDSGDEIGRLYAETNRMAAALSRRQKTVQAKWKHLNETIAERTNALQNANDRLARIDENRRRFFADVSHELRTPLTVIHMEAQIGRKENGPTRSAFATIETRAERLNQRIDDLLRVARSENGELALDPQPLALGELVGRARDEARVEIENAGMTLSVGDIPAHTLLADPNWTRQVIVSLIRNAIRHARDGAQIALTFRDAGNSVWIDLRDNGPGIPQTAQQNVFVRFDQGSTRSKGGFGIGLALAHWVIDAQDGEIMLTSPVRRTEALGTAPGTKISLRIPLVVP